MPFILDFKTVLNLYTNVYIRILLIVYKVIQVKNKGMESSPD